MVPRGQWFAQLNSQKQGVKALEWGITILQSEFQLLHTCSWTQLQSKYILLAGITNKELFPNDHILAFSVVLLFVWVVWVFFFFSCLLMAVNSSICFSFVGLFWAVLWTFPNLMETSVKWDGFHSVPMFGGMDGLALMSDLVASAEICRAQTPVYLWKPASVFLFLQGKRWSNKQWG